MTDYISIIIAKDFTDAPGPRVKEEGAHSGEEFYEKILEPKYIEAKDNGIKLFIDLDGTYGYGTSFLERSFGELARKFGEDVINRIVFKSEEEPYLVDEIKDYMNTAINYNDKTNEEV